VSGLAGLVGTEGKDFVVNIDNRMDNLFVQDVCVFLSNSLRAYGLISSFRVLLAVLCVVLCRSNKR
jgi:hypothetical protein